MNEKKEKLRLGVFVMAPGHHVAAWRHPDAQADAGVNFQLYKRVAQTAERGKFDMLFLADTLAAWVGSRDKESLGRSTLTANFEPITLLSALSAVTEHVGLVATATTTYNEPYHVARKFASLDHLSSGRAGWNLVTSANPAEAENFGRDAHLEHAKRYARAEEFINVVTGLWDSWEDDAFVRDKESGIFVDTEKLHVLNYKGQHFSVTGPLSVARPVQGYPVRVQAGSSGPGMELAARTAEVVFTVQQTLAGAQTFYADVKGRLEKYGRQREHLKIMPGVFPVVGRTEAEAQAKYDALQNLVHPAVGLSLLAGMIGGFDLSPYPLDGPLPELPESNSSKSHQATVVGLARRENLSIRQLYLRVAVSRGHRIIIGTPQSIADQLEEWFVNGGADGFNILPPYFPGGFDDFVDLVIPELQRRGLFRTEYEGKTLRENLGLPRPKNQFC
ncbi:MAG: LLM class flavin-dependent oxidoreductase [Pseudomonadota bacterium]